MHSSDTGGVRKKEVKDPVEWSVTWWQINLPFQKKLGEAMFWKGLYLKYCRGLQILELTRPWTGTCSLTVRDNSPNTEDRLMKLSGSLFLTPTRPGSHTTKTHFPKVFAQCPWDYRMACELVSLKQWAGNRLHPFPLGYLEEHMHKEIPFFCLFWLHIEPR